MYPSIVAAVAADRMTARIAEAERARLVALVPRPQRRGPTLGLTRRPSLRLPRFSLRSAAPLRG